MPPPLPEPPSVHHRELSKVLSPSAAESQLAAFLAKTTSQPHLHPDSLLTPAGVVFPPTSGPGGGLALHHLRRIGAGLRGENLVPETAEELAALTGEAGAAEGAEGAGLKRSDDVELDRSIAETERRKRRVGRGEEIEEWAAGMGQAADLDGADGEWQDKREFEMEQVPLEGEVGDREGAVGMMERHAKVPKIVEQGFEDSGSGLKTAEEKEARKKAKKARQLAERAEMAKKKGGHRH